MKKKTIVLAALLVLSTATGTAIYDPNKTYDDSDGQMHIMSSGSSASASAGVRENGSGGQTMWRAELSMENRSQDTAQTGTITNVSFHDTENDWQKVKFTGYVQTPTPCHTVGHEVAEENGTYTFTVQTHEPDSDQMCAQVLTTVQYSASFETEAPYTLVVKHGDTTIDTLESPQPVDEPQEPQKQSFLASLLNWFALLL